MRMQYATLKNKPRTLCSLTGFKPSEFEALLPSFGVVWEHFVSEMFKQKGRKRAYGGGRKGHLNQLEDKLLFILVYFRIYPTQEVHGYLFGMSQAQTNEWVHRLTGVLNEALGEEQQLPERRPANLEAVLSTCPSLEFMIDGTERPINRPKDKDKQKDYYSGKKKGHSVKNNVITERGGRVVYLSGTCEGKHHDKKLVILSNKSFNQTGLIFINIICMIYPP